MSYPFAFNVAVASAGAVAFLLYGNGFWALLLRLAETAFGQFLTLSQTARRVLGTGRNGMDQMFLSRFGFALAILRFWSMLFFGSAFGFGFCLRLSPAFGFALGFRTALAILRL